MASKRKYCVRCESLERPQKNNRIHLVKTPSGGEIPICATCLLEIQEEEDFINSLKEEEEEYESGSESFN